MPNPLHYRLSDVTHAQQPRQAEGRGELGARYKTGVER